MATLLDTGTQPAAPAVPKLSEIAHAEVLKAHFGSIDDDMAAHDVAVAELAREHDEKAEALYLQHFVDSDDGSMSLRPGVTWHQVEADEADLSEWFREKRETIDTEFDAVQAMWRERGDSTFQLREAWREYDQRLADAPYMWQSLKAWFDERYAQLTEGDHEAEDRLREEFWALKDAFFSGLSVLAFVEPEPDPARPADSGAPVFPRHVLDVGGLIGEICAWLNDTAHVPQPALSLGATITMLGAVFGRRYKVKGLGTLTNVLGLGLARTGGGKDHARSKLKQLMVSAGQQALLMGDEVTSGAAIRKALERHPIQLGFYDEFGRELQELKSWGASSHQKSTATTIMKMYGDSSSIALGKEYAASAGIERKDIHNPSLSIWATATNESLYAALTSGDAASGFLNRWIVIEGDKAGAMRALNFDDSAEYDAPPAELTDWLTKITTYSPDGAGNLSGVHAAGVAPGFFMMVSVSCQEARDLLNQIRGEQADHLANGKDATRDLYARYIENTVKVAMIRAIAENHEAPDITAEHVAWARDIVRYSIANMAYLMRAHVADNQQESNVKHVLDVIRRAGGEWVTRSDVTKGTQKLDRRTRDGILLDLVERGSVELQSRPSRGPRPVSEYRYIGE